LAANDRSRPPLASLNPQITGQIRPARARRREKTAKRPLLNFLVNNPG
jgi:hypothetical protein